jgi:DNA-binding CsgD family transcriptional regulator
MTTVRTCREIGNPRYLGWVPCEGMAMPVREADRVGRLARAGLDHITFQHEADEVLRAAVGYDVVAWGTVDPATLLVTGCTPIGDHPHDLELHLRNFEIEYLGTEPLTLSTLVKRDRPVSTLRSEVSDVRATKRYQEFLAPFGLTDELVAALTVNGRCWGAVRAYRRGEASEPFGEHELECFATVSQTLAEGLRLAFLRAATENTEAVDDPPGTVTLDRDRRPVACTPPAERWLDSLLGECDVTTVLSSLAGKVSTHDEASAMVVGTRGPIALHASRLSADDDAIAIVIERPRPVQLTPRIMEAYGLTPRESQVTELVLRGRTTAQIARAIQVSKYTVQDHLKSVFAKVDVQTRGELANEIHVRFYLPPKQAGVTPGPYGYFLGL